MTRIPSTNSTVSEASDLPFPMVEANGTASPPSLPATVELNDESTTPVAENMPAIVNETAARSLATNQIPLIPLLLPIDSLHGVASFLSPTDWSNFGQTGRAASRICREILRRVRMHGFRCATEVVTAWVRAVRIILYYNLYYRQSRLFSGKLINRRMLTFSHYRSCSPLETGRACGCSRVDCTVHQSRSSHLSALPWSFLSHAGMATGN